MNLKHEQEYIKNFISIMSDEELKKALEDCGNSVILPTEDIYTALKNKGFYDNMFQYIVHSNYIESSYTEKWSDFFISDSTQGVAA